MERNINGEGGARAPRETGAAPEEGRGERGGRARREHTVGELLLVLVIVWAVCELVRTAVYFFS